MKEEITKETVIELEVKNKIEMNPFTFGGRSNSENFFFYGIAVPLVLMGGGLWLLPKLGYIALLIMLIGAVILLAAVVRRGRDAGKTPSHTLGEWFIVSFILSGIVQESGVGMQLMVLAGGDLYMGMFLLAVVQNAYLLYLLLAPQSTKPYAEAKEKQKTDFKKIAILIMLGVVLVGGAWMVVVK